jgi:hypothetical protein
MIQLTVTDNGGLIATDSVKIYPDCSSAGLSVTNLTATPQINSVVLSWTNPSVSFDEIMVAAKASTGFLTNPSGTNYIADANFNGAGTPFEGGKIVYKGTGQLVTVTNLVAGTTYYFRVFTRAGTGWSGGVETSDSFKQFECYRCNTWSNICISLNKCYTTIDSDDRTFQCHRIKM